MEHESDGYTNFNWYSWYNHLRAVTRTEGLGNKRRRGDHPNYSIIKIGQNTEESPWRLETCCYQTPERNHQLTLVQKDSVPSDYEKKNKSLDIAREMKKLGNMKMTEIPSVIDTLSTLIKGLV